jgi:thiol-disulfide isomerase/thioredoxin
MSRVKPISAAVLLVGALVFAAYPAVAQEATTADLEKRIEALETRIQNLERSLGQRLANIERQVQQGAAAPHPKEQEAQNAYAEISRMVSDGKFEEAKTRMAAFMKEYGTTATAKRASRLNQELAVIGKSAPDAWGIEKWFQGESEIDLSSGKATLLVFWETWCPHCQREVPKVQALYDELSGKGLQVVALTKITKSATEEKVQSFLTEKKVSYPAAKEDGTVSRYFNVSGIPAAAVLKDGKVVWRGHPARLNQETLKGWL